MRVKHSRFLLLGLLFCAVADFWSPLFASEVSPAVRQTKIGLELFQRGDFEQAALSWKEAAHLYERSGEIRRQSEALVYLSHANQALGRYTEAGKNLELALGLAE